MIVRHPPVLETLRRPAIVLDGGANDYDALLRMVGDRSFVLLGEASHGTHEFYAMRAEITRRPIEDMGFDAVEADWPATELGSHYFNASLSAQLNAVLHLEETTVVEPFERTELWSRHEPPDTYPFGL
jgi:erythromycin esterase-like protein